MQVLVQYSCMHRRGYKSVSTELKTSKSRPKTPKRNSRILSHSRLARRAAAAKGKSRAFDGPADTMGWASKGRAPPPLSLGAGMSSSLDDCMRTGSCPWLLSILLSVSGALALVALAACVCVFRYRAALQKLQRRNVEATSSNEVTTRVAPPENFSGQQVLPSVDESANMVSALDPGTGLHTFFGIRRSWLVWPRTSPSEDDEIISISYDLSTTDKSSEPGAFDSGSDAREEQPESPGVSTPRGTLRHRLGAHFSSRRQAATEGLPSDHQARRAEYKAAKRTLRDFERAFESQHSRKPRYKKDWDPVYDVYLRYEALRREESPRSAEHAVGHAMVLSRPRAELSAELIVAAATAAAETTAAAAAAAASIPAPRGGQNLGAYIGVPKKVPSKGVAAAYLEPTCVLASSAPRHCASPLTSPLGHRDSGAGVGAHVVDAEVRAAPEFGHEVGSRTSARAERAKKEAALSDARCGPSQQLARTCDRCGRRACTCERLSL